MLTIQIITLILGAVLTSITLSDSINLRYKKIIQCLIILICMGNIAISINSKDQQQESLKQIVKQQYPLEPLTIYYTLEFPLSIPILQGYSDSVGKKILLLKNQRLHYYNSIKDIRNITEDINLTKDYPQFLPDSLEHNDELRQILFSNSIELSLIDDDSLQIVFPYSVNKNGSLKTKDVNGLSSTVLINFCNNKLIKKIKYEKPIRSGNDNLAKSVMDLVNRKLTWFPYLQYGHQLVEVGFQFSNDPLDTEFNRFIVINNSAGKYDYSSSTIIKAEDLGIEKIMKVFENQ